MRVEDSLGVLIRLTVNAEERLARPVPETMPACKPGFKRWISILSTTGNAANGLQLHFQEPFPGGSRLLAGWICVRVWHSGREANEG